MTDRPPCSAHLVTADRAPPFTPSSCPFACRVRLRARVAVRAASLDRVLTRVRDVHDTARRMPLIRPAGTSRAGSGAIGIVPPFFIAVMERHASVEADRGAEEGAFTSSKYPRRRACDGEAPEAWRYVSDGISGVNVWSVRPSHLRPERAR